MKLDGQNGTDNLLNASLKLFGTDEFDVFFGESEAEHGGDWIAIQAKTNSEDYLRIYANQYDMGLQRISKDGHLTTIGTLKYNIE